MVDGAIFAKEIIDKKLKKRVKTIVYLDIKSRAHFHFIT
ncbi:hypothetical protein SAMN04488697_10728 [Pseudomonas sp. 43mfcvi1.1]|jgi:hypothetical protein|nr:hypothetical protein ATJ40_10728 [Pseudomonas sp. 43mfcvi1.1]SSB97125.1 hypothetical protein SAMN04488697_10728 [Pseudomonas sp. 43mfcvi1.1]